MKKIMLISLLLLGSIVTITGGMYMNKINRQNQLVEIAHSEEVRNIVEEGLKSFDSNALTSKGIIRSYSFKDEEVEKNPMGGIVIYLTINDVPDYRITFFIDKSHQTGELFYSGGSHSSELQQLLESEGMRK